ncbi:MAG TPA: dihydrodipicolinate synthase family protein [Spirochaetota bacterium]|nr:dihydrodipicolinate synthase family protein [Spirochaetota bacterium]HPI90390.1 dihydrodipicolinate synthase family protein [Spirochaetota bacterium]HPR48527.1 dihydrodipicolinate synthase family protein [Spirochaetota bacterium]
MAHQSRSNNAFGGVFPVVPTPLREDQSVDYNGLEQLINFYINEGCHGLLVLGSYGEHPYFTFEERCEIIKHATRAAEGRVPVIACVGFTGLREAESFLEKTAPMPVDAYLVVLPTYFRVEHKDCLDYYCKLGEHADRPLLYYHIPQLTGIDPSPDEMSELLHLDCIAGVKDSSMNLGSMKRVLSLKEEAGLSYFAGSGLLLLETLKRGGAGVMCTVASLVPGLVVSCYEAYLAGEFKRAGLLQNKIFEFLPVMNSFSLPAGIQKAGFKVLSKITMSAIAPRHAISKEFLRQSGFPITSMVRSPLPQITEKDKISVTNYIKTHGVKK